MTAFVNYSFINPGRSRQLSRLSEVDAPSNLDRVNGNRIYKQKLMKIWRPGDRTLIL